MSLNTLTLTESPRESKWRADLVHFTPVSANSKTGPIPVSTSSRATCSPTCPWFEDGCYAKYGPLAWHWQQVTAGKRGLTWKEFLVAIRELPKGQLWRHDQAGDLAGRGVRLNVKRLRELTTANFGRRGFTFTHKPLYRAAEKEAVHKANHDGFAINLSADSLPEADRLKTLAIGPVVVVVPSFATMPGYTPAGHKLVPCPEMTDGIQCSRCQLCAHPERKSIVAFEAHGTGKKYIRQYTPHNTATIH